MPGKQVKLNSFELDDVLCKKIILLSNKLMFQITFEQITLMLSAHA